MARGFKVYTKTKLKSEISIKIFFGLEPRKKTIGTAVHVGHAIINT